MKNVDTFTEIMLYDWHHIRKCANKRSQMPFRMTDGTDGLEQCFLNLFWPVTNIASQHWVITTQSCTNTNIFTYMPIYCCCAPN